jgi:hypothetical protein
MFRQGIWRSFKELMFRKERAFGPPLWFWVRAALKIALWLQSAKNSRTLM